MGSKRERGGEMLPQTFFDGDTVEIARALVGKYLVRQYDGITLAARVTETEAYIGRMDKACHAYGYRKTERTKTLFAPPGTAYVYLIYGLHCCLNFVTGPEGEASAILVRGCAPVYNADAAARRRFPVWRDADTFTITGPALAPAPVPCVSTQGNKSP